MMLFSPFSLPPPKPAQPSTTRGYNVGSSLTDQPKADKKAARHVRRRHVSRVKLPLYSAHRHQGAAAESSTA